MTVVPDLTAKATPTNIDGTVEQPLTARRLTKDRGGQGRPGVLYRWAASMATHWRTVLVVWAVVVSACIIAMPAVEKSLKAPDFNVTTADSTEAARILDRDFPSVGAEQNVVVFDFRQHDIDAPASQETILRALS